MTTFRVHFTCHINGTIETITRAIPAETPGEAAAIVRANYRVITILKTKVDRSANH